MPEKIQVLASILRKQTSEQARVLAEQNTADLSFIGISLGVSLLGIVLASVLRFGMFVCQHVKRSPCSIAVVVLQSLAFAGMCVCMGFSFTISSSYKEVIIYAGITAVLMVISAVLFNVISVAKEDDVTEHEKVEQKCRFGCYFCFNLFTLVLDLVFNAADVVQFLGFISFEIPETPINWFLNIITTIHPLIGIAPIALSVIITSVITTIRLCENATEKNDELKITSCLKLKPGWRKLLHLMINTVDNYAQICLANLVFELWQVNPYITVVLALIVGQSFVQDILVSLVVAFMGVFPLMCALFSTMMEVLDSCDMEDEKCCSFIFAVLRILVGIALVAVSVAIPAVYAAFGLIQRAASVLTYPFDFLTGLVGIHFDEDKISDDVFSEDNKAWMMILGALFQTVAMMGFFWAIGTVVGEKYQDLVMGLGFAGSAVTVLVQLVVFKCEEIVDARTRFKNAPMGHEENPIFYDFLNQRQGMRYSMIPYLGPLLGNLNGFLNSPGIIYEGECQNKVQYILNFLHFAAFVGAVVCYELKQYIGTIVLLVVNVPFILFDAYDDSLDMISEGSRVTYRDSADFLKRIFNCRKQAKQTKEKSKKSSRDVVVVIATPNEASRQ